MEKFIYLAGPIADCTLKEATTWRNFVTERFVDNIIGISPMREKAANLNVGSGRISGDGKAYADTLMSNQPAIFQRDKFDCATADGVLAYLPKEMNDRRPSLGTVIELGWANARDIPIVLVTDDPYYANHPLVMGCCGWIVDDLELGIQVINNIFGAYQKAYKRYEVVKETKPTILDDLAKLQKPHQYQNMGPVPSPVPMRYA